MRPNKDHYFSMMASIAATRSTCPKAQVGAVLVREGTVIGTGYNGAPSGFDHCLDIGCAMINDGERDRCVRTVHAEVNAILQGLRAGSVKGTTLYTTHSPCSGM